MSAMSDQMSDNIIIQCDTVSTSADIRKYDQYYIRNNICNNNKGIAKPNSEIFEFATARRYDLWSQDGSFETLKIFYRGVKGQESWKFSISLLYILI